MNFFIQTTKWDKIVEAESCYPIIYELATIPLMVLTFCSQNEVKEYAHIEPRGCPFDFCIEKEQYHFKIRSGDICPDCREKMIKRKVEPRIAKQVFDIYDEIRDQVLFRRRFDITHQLSRIHINIYNRRIYFPDLGTRYATLSAQQMAIYLFYLKHPEGAEYKNLQKDHFNELVGIYRNFAGEAFRAKLNDTVEALLKNPNQTVSRIVYDINKKITDVAGNELSQHYIIDRRKKKARVNHLHFIAIDRGYVSYGGDPFH